MQEDKTNFNNHSIDELERILQDLLDGKIDMPWYPIQEDVKARIYTHIVSVRAEIRARQAKQRRLYLLGLVLSFLLIGVSAYNLYYIIIPKEHVVASAPGQFSRINIGSATIHLNTNTKLSVKNGNADRHTITLKDGEIFVENPGNMYFEIIAKDKIIVFFNGSIDVINRDDYLKVTSLNADVIVNSKMGEATINPNEQYREYKGNKDKKFLNQAGNVGMFRNGFLYYDEDPLSYVLQDIANSFQLEITFQAGNKLPDKIAINGLFSIHSDPLEIIRTILPPPYSAVKEGNKIKIEAGSLLDR